tara:strand:+ start:2397 stop:3632 length:1236 start_codon:yes stop_codon:yes gene_type:complete
LKLKILIYGLNYYPEKVGIAKYTTEMADWFKKNKHEVRVITSNPYFPEWKLKSNSFKKEIIKSIQIERCMIWVPKKPTAFNRILHLLSFSLTSLPLIIRQIFWQPDVIFTIAPSFLCAPNSILISKLCPKRVINWIHFQDLELDAAFNLGLINNKQIRKISKIFESIILKNFNVVSAISYSMMNNLSFKGVKKDNLFYLPNWVDINEIYPKQKFQSKNQYVQKLSLKKNQIVLMYSGSINKKQGIDLILKLINHFKDREDILWIIAAGGPSYGEIKRYCKSYKNALCLPLQPRKDLNNFLNIADIHLIPQKKGAEDLVMPSKLLAILASGKAFIAASSEKSELGKIALQKGVRVNPDDFNQFKNAINELTKNKDLRNKLGKKARAYAVENYEKYKLLESLNKKMIFEVNKK